MSVKLCSLFVDKYSVSMHFPIACSNFFLAKVTLLLMTYVSKSFIYNLMHVLLHFLGRMFLWNSHAHATLPYLLSNGINCVALYAVHMHMPHQPLCVALYAVHLF